MRVIIQAWLNGMFETIWSGHMLHADNTVHDARVQEVLGLANLLAQTATNRTFQVGVREPNRVTMITCSGDQLPNEAYRAMVFATRGCVTV